MKILNQSDLEKISGGAGPVAAIVAVAGVIVAGSQIYQFGRGFVDGIRGR
ncbi:class IIb bacteriocin, lactobin A/cerein 7B family [Neisseria chenwenguii]|uniref:Uncharacterized protein n=1 Tax=Neisseria chenwenguii TaxID=1853278 RepID=A0A220RZU2_9NEIS|nr:class IIb bacteriocin, lactobin A/cerein 7B family [Neisseria chenwenguii]ASK26658.1 hypothetical protein BG910_01880 [Neisseria chenwenguii]ROV56320.1 class IIb bacteriocin, lactobin A/cerein 7B family [Neisseria chenwenguii]